MPSLTSSDDSRDRWSTSPNVVQNEVFGSSSESTVSTFLSSDGQTTTGIGTSVSSSVDYDVESDELSIDANDDQQLDSDDLSIASCNSSDDQQLDSVFHFHRVKSEEDW